MLLIQVRCEMSDLIPGLSSAFFFLPKGASLFRGNPYILYICSEFDFYFFASIQPMYLNIFSPTRFVFLFLLLSPVLALTSEERKSLTAIRTDNPPVIDGNLEDPAWENAPAATDFHQYEPHNDRPASFETEVRVLYDDNAVYIGAKMFDPEPDRILQELGLRNSGHDLNADRFYVEINPFDDGINGFRFQLSASGVQTDANLSSGGRHGDLNWDAVWVSETNITEEGWIVEMMIPYSALRFPRNDMHEWGINFWREIRRTRELSSWNFVDRRVGDELTHMGQLKGINGVTPPMRLSFYPYISNYAENNGFDRGWANSFHGGMDVKYGISPSFTMDMTLIPDFGQVQSDAKVLNLSPFEIRYDENRQFFTEGTELFQKADLFYSRRVGDRPRGYHLASQNLEHDERIKDNPLETQMINATKISGRTSNGLGLGFFNAMTSASNAILEDTITGETREITTQPFTNYNLVVVDQSLPNNSYVSFINTNVAGSADGYTANVTGADFRLLDNSNIYQLSGSGALSQQYYRGEDNTFGYKYDVRIGKTGGTWRAHYDRSVLSETYDQNDMGFLRRNNQIQDGLTVSHHVFDPFWRFWMFTNTLSFNYSRLYEPRTFTGMEVSHRMMMLFDTRFHISLNTTYQPRGERDYYEPRVPGRYYRTDEALRMHMSYSSDYRRRLFVDGSFNFGRTQAADRTDEYGFMLRPTFRVSDHLNLSYGFEYNELTNDLGWVPQPVPDTIYFGRRQSPTMIHTMRSTLIFTNDLSLNFDLRHYWSRVEYDGQYYHLEPDGHLSPIADDLEIADINYNAFTIDMLLTWHFAPGSQMTLAWKNVIDHRDSMIPPGYMDNFRDMLEHPQINSLSIKVLYYLDFHSIQSLNQRLRHG